MKGGIRSRIDAMKCDAGWIEHLASVFDEPITHEKFLKEFDAPGYNGGGIELSAAAEKFNIQIAVIHRKMERANTRHVSVSMECLTIQAGGVPSSQPTCALLWTGGHYETLYQKARPVVMNDARKYLFDEKELSLSLDDLIVAGACRLLPSTGTLPWNPPAPSSATTAAPALPANQPRASSSAAHAPATAAAPPAPATDVPFQRQKSSKRKERKGKGKGAVVGSAKTVNDGAWDRSRTSHVTLHPSTRASPSELSGLLVKAGVNLKDVADVSAIEPDAGTENSSHFYVVSRSPSAHEKLQSLPLRTGKLRVGRFSPARAARRSSGARKADTTAHPAPASAPQQRTQQAEAAVAPEQRPMPRAPHSWSSVVQLNPALSQSAARTPTPAPLPSAGPSVQSVDRQLFASPESDVASALKVLLERDSAREKERETERREWERDRERGRERELMERDRERSRGRALEHGKPPTALLQMLYQYLSEADR